MKTPHGLTKPKTSNLGSVHFVVSFACVVISLQCAVAQQPDFLWANRFGGTTDDQGEAVAVDRSGNVVLAGSFQGTASFGPTNLTSVVYENAFVAKFGPDGSLIWARQFDGTGTRRCTGMSLDKDGNVLITGPFSGVAAFDDTPLVAQGQVDAFVCKLAPSGVILWAKQIATSSGHYLAETEIAADSEGNCYVVGSYEGQAVFTSTNLQNSGSDDILLAKYDPNGKFQWARKAGGAGGDFGLGIAVDGDSNVFVAGSFCGSATFGGTNLSSVASCNAFLAKYDSAGNLGWVTQSGGTTPDTAIACKVDKNGNAFVVGQHSSSTLFGVGNLPVAAPGGNLFLAQLSGSGDVTWVKSFTCSGGMDGPKLALDLAGHPHLTGRFSSNATFGNLSLSSNPGDYQIFVVKCGAGGIPEWAHSAGGTASDKGDGIAVDGAGNAFVTGYFKTNATFGTFTLSAPSATETLRTDAFLTKLGVAGRPSILVNDSLQSIAPVYCRGPAQISLRNDFPNGSMLFTLDGRQPDLSSTLYTEPFQAARSCVLRVVGFNSDLTSSAETLPLQIEILPTLTAHTSGQGSVLVYPTEGPYVSNAFAFVTAIPQTNWSLLHWLGDASGTNHSATVAMTRNANVQPVFGTTLATSVVGEGQIRVSPIAEAYPYGAEVTLTAIPETGNYFAFWANAASSTNNPLHFRLTNSNPTLTAVFQPLTGGQLSLTVIVEGKGLVVASPTGRQFNPGQVVNLTARPDSGETFVEWMGAISGNQPSVSITLNQSAVVTARFTSHPRVEVSPFPVDVIEEGFRFNLLGEMGSRCSIEFSTNLTDWTSLFEVTNRFGVLQVDDFSSAGSHTKFYRALKAP